MRFIGDVHGLWAGYEEIIHDCDASVQVGDFGVGFSGENPCSAMLTQQAQARGNHRFIRGNHDNPEVCHDWPAFIPCGTVDEHGILYVGGAYSIDAAYRTPGLSWWPDEENSDEFFEQVIDSAIYNRPEVIVSHDAPYPVTVGLGDPRFGPVRRTRTSHWLEKLWAAHSPRLWVFGHWHKDFDEAIGTTRFVCLDELSYVDIPV